jgi:hypothetical protein
MRGFDKPPSKARRLLAAATILAVYTAALCLVVVQIDITPDAGSITPDDGLVTSGGDKWGRVAYTGHEALRGLWEGKGIIPELANVALGVGVLALIIGRFRLAKVMGVIGVVLALSAPYVFEVHVTELRAGYYLWLLCMVMLAVVAYRLDKAERVGGTAGGLS